jgi:hypothetical protein
MDTQRLIATFACLTDAQALTCTNHRGKATRALALRCKDLEATAMKPLFARHSAATRATNSRSGSSLYPAWAIVGALFVAMPASGATYYVDFDAGDDSAAGTSAATAWKHAPGDSAATGAPTAATVAPGDMVRFKGGVIYRGSVVCKWSGEEGKSIVVDGNSDGSWGAGHAVIDGSEPLPGWRPAQSGEECRGNPRWKSLVIGSVPVHVDLRTLNLCQGDRLLTLAQDPNQPDPFFADKVEHFYTLPKEGITATSIVDPAHLSQPDAHHWDDAWLMIWHVPNVVSKVKLQQFLPAERKLVFPDIKQPYTDRPTRYAIYNSVHLIDRPGEYAVSQSAGEKGRSLVYLWPLDDEKPDRLAITMSVRDVGIDVLPGVHHVTVQGLAITKIAGADLAGGVAIRARSLDASKEIRGLSIRNNVITKVRHAARGYGGIHVNGVRDCLIEGNEIRECPLSMGILVGGSRNVMTRGNTVYKAGGQSIWYMGCTDSSIVGNTVRLGQGTHANGISVYLNSKNVLVYGNTVIDSNISITVEASENVTLAYNVCYNPSFYVVAEWSKVPGLKIYNNTLIRDEDLPSISLTSAADVRNNIGKTYAPQARLEPDARHNIFCNQSDLAKILRAPAQGDYHLKAGSPAIDAGVDVGFRKDVTDAKVPQGRAPDIGAFEHITP